MINDREHCLFCGIADRRVGALVIYEDEHVVAFLDIHPRTDGHTVVVPKFHAATLQDLPDREVGPLFLGVRHAAKKLSRALGVEGLTIGINQGSVSGQTIDHLHVHIFPRFVGDGGGSVHSIIHSPSVQNVEEVYKKLKT